MAAIDMVMATAGMITNAAAAVGAMVSTIAAVITSGERTRESLRALRSSLFSGRRIIDTF